MLHFKSHSTCSTLMISAELAHATNETPTVWQLHRFAEAIQESYEAFDDSTEVYHWLRSTPHPVDPYHCLSAELMRTMP